jgi:hypothetical protein
LVECFGDDEKLFDVPILVKLISMWIHFVGDESFVINIFNIAIAVFYG